MVDVEEQKEVCNCKLFTGLRLIRESVGLLICK